MLEDHLSRGPMPLADILADKVGEMAARQAGNLRPWWTDNLHASWQTVESWWPELTREEIRRDPGDVDQAIREMDVCRSCRAGQSDGQGGVLPCGLKAGPWLGAPMHPGDSNMWYLVHRRLPYAEGETPRYEWRKKRCGGPQARALEMAAAEKRMVNIGGMRAMVVDEDIPFAEGDC